MIDRTQLHQHLGEEAHVQGARGCAVGYLMTPDIILARRIFTQKHVGRGLQFMGVWLISKNIGFHLGSECPNR